MIKLTRNAIAPCDCGCSNPIIEEFPNGDVYRVICPECKNGEDLEFKDSIQDAIDIWNTYRRHWLNQSRQGEPRPKRHEWWYIKKLQKYYNEHYLQYDEEVEWYAVQDPNKWKFIIPSINKIVYLTCDDQGKITERC